jgi:RHH-type proline utilization regulon transcriptional repressor/proline dehydrogenase/delta 1-pyrroline-5-carboxylate dehydrogenase
MYNYPWWLMPADPVLETAISDLERKLSRQGDGHHAFTLTPAWWQERLLDWATNDPDFRTKLLRFVDVLPTLRTTKSVADHVRQYFRGAHPGLIRTASGLASEPIFRPVLSQVVRQGVFGMAHRFIAGATPAEALPALRKLTEHSVGYTVDLLGEETLSEAEADAYLARYTELLETLAAAGLELPASGPWSGVPAVNISIKLSAVCSHLEPAAPEYVSSAARERLRPLLRLARQHGAFINVDMEQYRFKDIVHTTFADLLMEDEFRDYPHAGIVVQAYLRDALDDVARLRALAKKRGAPFSVRLVKGAYWDEENIVAGQNSWPAPVWGDKGDTDRNYEACTDALLDAWPYLRGAFGTHNPQSVAQAIAKARSRGMAAPDVEFQMLYGMAEDLRNAVAEEGYRTRVYLPAGRVIPGMAYLVRRLLENTSNQAWFNVGVTQPSPVAPGPKPAPPTSVAQGPSPESRHLPDTSHLTPGAFSNAAPAQFFEPAVREQMRRALGHARDGFGRPYPLLIGGRRLDDRELAEIAYPADPSTIIGRVAQATADDVEDAVAAAHEAFPDWRDLPPLKRTEILLRAADIMEERRFELAATMVFESAKPWHEADGDVIEAIDYLRYYALQGEQLATPRKMGDIPGERNEYFHEGRGVTAVIAPWNFPLAIICGMTVASLAGGNCAIVKPAAQSPVIAFKLVELLREAGVPDGAVQYLPGPGSRIGEALVEHLGVANIAFTGSKEVGLGIIESAARPPPLSPKRVVAEMGGKNAMIIDDDADLDQAISAAVTSAFGYAGQKCSACSRLIIVGHAYEEAIGRLKNAVESLVVGPPHDPATSVPPVISASARHKILSYIDEGASTATLLAQAPVPAGEGAYVPPTVFTDVPPDSKLAREEIFGPVLSVFHAASFGDALDIAMDSEFALTGGVFSRNPRHVDMARRRFHVGNLYINRKITGAVVGRQPFGGLAMSGIGEKAGGPDYVRQFMDPRTITENTTRRGFAPED